MIRIRQGGEAGRRVAVFEPLVVEVHAPSSSLEEVCEAETQVRAVAVCLGLGRTERRAAEEVEAAVVGGEGLGNQTLAAAGLQLEPRIAAHAQGQVAGIEIAVGALIAVAGGRADLDEVVDPVMALATGGQRVGFVEARRELVLNDQPGFVSAQTLAANEQAVGDRGRHRLGEQDAALEIIDVVVVVGRQVHDAGHEPGILVARFDPHALGAGEDVLPAQVVERPARAAELLAAGHGAGFGDEAVEHQALLAEVGRRRRLVVKVRAVESTLDLREFVVPVADVEATPERVALRLAQFDVELARGRSALLDRAVVAERGIVVVGIDAPEQVLG